MDEAAPTKKCVSAHGCSQPEGPEYSALRSSFEPGDGIIMMAIRDIFWQMTLQQDRRFTVSCSFLEIYNDVVHDLLTTTDQLGNELQIIEMNVDLRSPLE